MTADHEDTQRAKSTKDGGARRGGPPRDADEDEQGREEFARMLAQFESSREAETPAIGKQVRGRIVQIGEETTFVDFGGRSEGAIETRHFRDAEGKLTVAIGDAVVLFVIDNSDSVILAPSVRADPSVALAQLAEARSAGMPVAGQVTGLNTGGLEVDVAGLRGFCPVSQIEAGYCEDPSVYLGRSLEFLVTELAEGGRRLVLSRRTLLRRQEEERARELLASLGEGVELDGAVSRIERFGAFIDLGGVDGLVHVSEIRHERTENPSEVLAVGQRVRVKVLTIQPSEKGRPRISLSMKATLPDPWDEAEERFWPGRRARGTVVRLADFGAFVNLAPGIDGLVHVSEIALRPVARPRDALEQGQEVEVVVLAVDVEKRRISLSIKDALAAEAVSSFESGEEVLGERAAARESTAGEHATGGDTTDSDTTDSDTTDSDTTAGAPSRAEGDPSRGERSGAPQSAAQPREPKRGDLADGWVASIKPYGLFVDLPAYGHRARGLLPHEETGERANTDLTRRFRVGDQLRVEIIDVDAQGRIRISLTRARDRAEKEHFEGFRPQAAQGKGDSSMAEALRRAMEKRAAKNEKNEKNEKHETDEKHETS